MLSVICEAIDRWVIRSAAKRLPPPTGADPHLAQAAEMIRKPGFFYNGVVPAPMELLGGKKFKFSSPVQTAVPENNTVYGNLARCGARWRQRPAVILLHGWNDKLNYNYRFPSLARDLTRRGVNSIIFEMPYHFRRRPARKGVRSDFISEDLAHTVEATHQALAEINAMVAWLQAQGVKRVALWGFSLGGWLAGLAACFNPAIACAVLVTPVVRMDRMVQDTPFCKLLRGSLGAQSENMADWSKLNLTAHKPLVPKINILLIQAQYDLFVPGSTLEELCQTWDEPEMWRLPHGHISVLTSSSTMKEVMRWMGPRLRWGH
jgi:dienelactone hydrolase